MRWKIFEKRWVLWITLAICCAGVLWIDYTTGPSILFPAWMILPVLLASWFDGYWAGCALAIILPLVRLGFKFIWPYIPWPMSHSYYNFVIRVTALGAIAILTAKTSELTRRVRTMEGLLYICMYCHRMRTDAGVWERLEMFLAKHSEASFTHRICPDCLASRHLT